MQRREPKRILFAWELGGNLGHIAKYLPLLRVLHQRGHDVLFASKDVELAERLLRNEGIPHIQAPIVTRFKGKIREPASFADVLAELGFAEADTLSGLISGWRSLMTLYKPDVLVAEYAPAAQIAAGLHSVKCLRLSTGFECPPDITPFPLFRPWLKLSEEDRLTRERQLLSNLNAVCTRQGAAQFSSLQKALNPDLSLMATLPELDHYGNRKGANYIGPMYTLEDGLTCNWPAHPGIRIFAYIRPYPELPHMLDALRNSMANVLAVVPGISAEKIAEYSSERFRIFSEQLKLAHLMQDMDLAITHGGHGLAGAFLIQGVPTLTVPTNIEQWMVSNRLVRLGIGNQITRNRVKVDFAGCLSQMIGSSIYGDRARSIAKRYAGYKPDRVVQRIANTIERLPESVNTRNLNFSSGATTIH